MSAGERCIFRQALTCCALVLVVGCEGSLPVAPSELTTGIVVYEHADFAGASAHVTQDIKDLKDFNGPCLERDFETTVPGGIAYQSVWNDCISSIRVAAGWRVVLFEHEDFDGDQLDVTTEIPDLTLSRGDCDKGGFNDCATSIRVVRP